jgi:hypothetical protein
MKQVGKMGRKGRGMFPGGGLPPGMLPPLPPGR